MPLSSAKRKAAADIAQKNHNWEKLAHEQSAPFRADPNGYIEAFLEYERLGPFNYSVPPSSELENVLKEVEARLNPNPQTHLERLTFVNALMFLCRCWMTLIAERDYSFSLEISRQVEKLNQEHPPAKEPHMVLPATLHPFLAELLGTSGSSQLPTSSSTEPPSQVPDHPMTVPARPFNSADLTSSRSIPVTATDLINFKRDHERLLFDGHVFAAEDEGTFKVWSVNMTADKDKWYYLVFADEGPEGVCYSSDDFFELLRVSVFLVPA
ncbi:hypothetical protein B0H19DRAFT_1269976 [Mycena capillaripes]|nr:hypothetical protein B0H19DRAFT_1269976 [Mycena capillaripes]